MMVTEIVYATAVLQVLSNGIYKSVIHRAVVNSTEARISIPTFYCPSPDAVIEPASPLVTTDNPALYKKFTYGEYYQKFWSKGLEGKSCLNYFTADNNPTVTQSEN
jgi:salicylic acid 3-hydroxylase